MFNWSESIKYTTEINDRNILVSAYLYLGYIIIVSDRYQAKKHYEKSLKFSVEVKDYISQPYADSALGNLDEGMKTGKSGHIVIESLCPIRWDWISRNASRAIERMY